MNHLLNSIASSRKKLLTGKVRPGTDSVGQPPKKAEIFSASTVALMSTTLRREEQQIQHEAPALQCERPVMAHLRSFFCSSSVLRTMSRKSAVAGRALACISILEHDQTHRSARRTFNRPLVDLIDDDVLREGPSQSAGV
jgi:hypothetical protein